LQESLSPCRPLPGTSWRQQSSSSGGSSSSLHRGNCCRLCGNRDAGLITSTRNTLAAAAAAPAPAPACVTVVCDCSCMVCIMMQA
jgi:hypothetical protein